ncbi:HNH endonuclease [Bacillus pumilus]|uniref:HNH endonuclease n=1 Tax=Bacillus pumilus TaxID=1408 RepID=UPI003D032EE6
MSEARQPHNKLEVDEEFIRKHYHCMTAKEIGNSLGVSRETINHRVIAMGLRKTQLPYIPEEGEICKPLKEYAGYGITNKSRVVKLKNNTVLKTKIDSDGYVKATMFVDGIRKEKRVHRLVAEYFIDNPKNLPVVNHLDGNKANPDISNLEWVTVKGNAEHASKHGLLRKGEDSPNAKITNAQAKEILHQYKQGITIKELKKLHTYASESIITKICYRHRWKHLDQTS